MSVQVELVFWLLVCLQFTYNMYLSIMVHTFYTHTCDPKISGGCKNDVRIPELVEVESKPSHIQKANQAYTTASTALSVPNRYNFTIQNGTTQ